MPPAELTGTTPTQDPVAAADPRALCQRIFSVFADGQLPDFEALFHPEAVNREASTQPSACRGRGRPRSTRPVCGCAAPLPTCTGTSTR